jgi:hypothetical protein
VVDKLVSLVTNEPVAGENNVTQAQYEAYMAKLEAHIVSMEQV